MQALPEVIIRPIRSTDAAAWERLRNLLWPSDPDGPEDHGAEIESFFAGRLVEPLEVLLAEGPSGEALALAELSIRTDPPRWKVSAPGTSKGSTWCRRFALLR